MLIERLNVMESWILELLTLEMNQINFPVIEGGKSKNASAQIGKLLFRWKEIEGVVMRLLLCFVCEVRERSDGKF